MEVAIQALKEGKMDLLEFCGFLKHPADLLAGYETPPAFKILGTLKGNRPPSSKVLQKRTISF